MTATTTTLDALRTLFNSRASMRDFEDTPVPDDVLADILRLTQVSPCS
jgi:nitroreductase